MLLELTLAKFIALSLVALIAFLPMIFPKHVPMIRRIGFFSLWLSLGMFSGYLLYFGIFVSLLLFSWDRVIPRLTKK